MRRLLLSVVAVATLAILSGPAAAQPVPDTSTTSVSAEDEELIRQYAQTYSYAVVAFVSVPAEYPGGPAASYYVELKRSMTARLNRARAFIVARVGEAPIAKVEGDIEEELNSVWFVSDPAAHERGRAQYEESLRKLERKVARARRDARRKG